MDEQKLLKKKRQAQKDHNWRLVGDCSNKLGALYSDTGEYEQAIVQFKDEFSAYKSLGMKMEAAHAERMIGEMLMYQGEYDAALKFAQSYLKTAVEERNKVEEQRAYATIARIHLVHGQSEEKWTTRHRIINLAQKAFLQAALLCKSIEKQVGRYQAADMEARVYLNLGVCKEYCEEYAAAVDYMQTAMSIAKKFDLHELLYQCYTSAGLMHSIRTGDTRKSLLMFNLALQTAERLVDKKKKMCETLQMSAEVSLKIGDIQSAKQSLVNAFKMRCDEKSLREAIEKSLKVLIAVEKAQDQLLNSDSQEYEVQKGLYETLGDGWCQLGNYSKAIEHYLKMLGCAELDGVSGKALLPIYVSLYQTYKDNKQYDQALVYMKKEHELIENNPKEAFETLMNISEVQELAGKNFFEIEETYKAAQILARTISDQMPYRRVLFKLLQLCRKHGMIINEEEITKELSDLGMTTEELERDFENEGSPCSEEEPDVPDIGHDIHLEELFISDDDQNNTRDRTSERNTRTKRTGLNLQTKRNQKGETPLHLACISGNLTLVKQLLDQGHEMIVRDNAGWIPLHEACNHGYKEIVEELLSRSGNRGINDRGGTKCDGVTPLYDACSNGNLEIVELLLERGADPTMKTNDGDSVLNALELWRRSAAGLSVAEESLYEALHQKMRHSLEKTGNLNVSKEKEGRRKSKQEMDIEVRSTTSSTSSERRRTPMSRNIRQGIDISSSDDDSDVEIATTSRITSLVHKPSEISEQKRARSDYKEVMSNLRKPHSSSFPSHSPYSDTSDKRQSALISTTNTSFDDDWLENDLGPQIKKQRFMQEPLAKTPRHSFSPAKIRSSLPSPAKKKSSQEIDSTINDLADWDSMIDGFDNENDVPLWQSTGKSRVSLSPQRRTNPIKRQSSLLSAGFVRSQSPKTFQADDVPDSTINEHFSVVASPFKTIPERMTGLKIIVVKIADELISVPVKAMEIDNLDVGWLVNEVTRRYSNLFGRSPEIRITLDNALVETTDPLAIVFTATEIGARILKFNTISLMNRYRSACQELKTPVIDDVINALELSLPSKRLTLAEQLLTPAEILPVTMALKQETELLAIDLDNNWLQNTGIKHLSEALMELKGLEEIHLCGNSIEAEGVKMMLGNGVPLENLSSLTLDFNPLGDAGGKLLFETGHRWCPNLSQLSASGCEIRVVDGDLMLLRQLTHLNLSENPLDRQSFEGIARSINRERITVLNLNNISGQNTLNWFLLFQHTFPVMKELHLASNRLTDEITSELLATAVCLNLLDLSHNLSLTSATFEYFMRRAVGGGTHIQKIYLNGCQKLLPSRIPNTTDTITNTRPPISLPEYMELTLNITNPMERQQQETYVRRIWDDCYNNNIIISNNNDDDDDDDDDEATNESRQHRRTQNRRIGYVKVNKFHLTAFVLDTPD